MGSSGQTTGQDPKIVLATGTDVADYVIDGLIGHGGMGQVYSAVHRVIGKRAAVKVLLPKYAGDPSTVERFVTEARAANQIGHRNIVDVFAFGQLADGRPFMVMELLTGVSLGDRVDAGPLPLADVMAIVAQIASALAAAHAKRIIHRDLKPDNVFLADGGDGPPLVKLLDFGIAKLVADDEPRMVKTQTGVMMGTPAYMAPEQARGKDIDDRVDIYSLGVMMYEMLVGELPFAHDNVVDMLFSHASAPPPRPSQRVAGIPPAIDDLVVALMAKQPADRPPLRVVRSMCRGDATPLPVAVTVPPSGPVAMAATPVPTPPPARASSRRRLGMAVVAAGIAIAGGVAAFAIVRSQSDDKAAATPPAIAEPPPAPVLEPEPVIAPETIVAPVPPPPEAPEAPTPARASPPIGSSAKPRKPPRKIETTTPAATPPPVVEPEPPEPEPPKPEPPKPEPPKPEPPKPAVDNDGLMLPSVKKKKTSP